MAKAHIINKDMNTGIDIKHGDGVWTVRKTVEIDVTTDAAFNNSTGHDNVRYVVEGTLGADDSTMYWGIFDNGRNNRITVTESGRIGGDTAIHSAGKNLTVLNDGVIIGPDNGMHLEGKNFNIKNSGVIAAEDASGHSIYIDGAGASGRILNDTDGLINGQIVSESTKGVKIVNEGTIANVTASFDIVLGAGDDRFTNKGSMMGTALLGEGEDVADLRGGTVGGYIRGGRDSDTYIVDSWDAKIFEDAGEGNDTIRTSSNFSATENNVGSIENFIAMGEDDIALIGNGLSNIIRGNDGRNLLSGGAGEDELTGGKGKDSFNFGTSFGGDQIMDFENGKDVIEVSGWDDIDSFGDIEKIAGQQGKDVVMGYLGDTLVLRDTKLAELDASDFAF